MITFSAFKIFFHWNQSLLFSYSHLLFPSPRFFFSSLLLKICVYSIFLSYHLPSNFSPSLILPFSFFFPFSSSTVPFFYFPSSSTVPFLFSFPFLLLQCPFFYFPSSSTVPFLLSFPLLLLLLLHFLFFFFVPFSSLYDSIESRTCTSKCLSSSTLQAASLATANASTNTESKVAPDLKKEGRKKE